MKTLQCEICGADVKGENFDAYMEASRNHWTAEHPDLMKQRMQEWMSKPKEEIEKFRDKLQAEANKIKEPC